MVMKKELNSEDDIKILVDAFYDSVGKDSLLSPIFNDFAKVDWTQHLPVMYSFWSAVLFGTTTYKGQPFPKHLPLPVTAEHFTRWVQLFTGTIDSLFEGVKAEEAKQKAASIAQVFQMRLGLINYV
jgi:hemoglobin